MTKHFDLFVIGGGGAGSEVAFRVGETKTLKVGLVERDTLGGECNHYGCVPSKAMLKAAKIVASARHADAYGIRVRDIEVDFPRVMERVFSIVSHFSRYGTQPFEDIGVEVFLGPTARFIDEHTMELDDGTMIEADRFVIAAGSKAAIPPIAGLRECKPWTNEEATHLTTLPSSVSIIGGGPIGVEFAQIFSRLGSRVTVIEVLDRILGPEDEAASAVLQEALEREGVDIITGAKIERVDPSKAIVLADGRTIRSDEILVAAGRMAPFDLLDPQAAGVKIERGRPVLEPTLQTTAPHIWCAGDVTGALQFTHVASYEAQVVADQIVSGKPSQADYRVIPKVTYTDPEVASVGLTQAQAREQGFETSVGLVRFEDNERAYIEGETSGFVKIIADAKTKEILGGHITGSNAGELIHEIVGLMSAHTPVNLPSNAVHAYPTLSESIRSALIEAAR
ncbi:MAG: dihydrolipoyl dehydrogenase family protein [Actinomycetota bacterium]